MNKFLRFFAPPVFQGNKEKTQSAKLLYQIIRLMWVLPILLVTIGILGRRAEVAPPAIVISIILLTIMVLSQIGSVGLASTFLTATIILLIGYADFQNAGNIQPSTLMFAIAIIMSGLLLGRRAPLVTAILILVSHTIIVYFQLQGLIKLSSAPAVGFENIVITSIMVMMIGFLFQFVISRLQTALDQTRENERELQISNRELEESRLSLELRVAERTKSLELAAEVGRAVSQVRDLNAMLKDACELILKEFDLYYVQVYLTDASQTTLKLEAGTGDVGAQLVGRGHDLPLDMNSINGRAAVEQHAIVIADTAQSATFRKNPLLPQTRGEMAVPLIVANKVVGVLDMQSSQPTLLTEEVLPAFKALAGQLAVAIQNANLLAETEAARAEVEKQARRLVRTGWNEHLDAVHKPEQIGFVFDRHNVTQLAEIEEAPIPAKGNSVGSSISVTGEPLGSLVVEMDETSRKDQAAELVNIVAHQVAQQIENLRLLESAERYRYEAEQAARRLTQQGWQEYIKSRSISNLGYWYDLNEVRPSGNGYDKNPSMLTLPLKVREEMIGKLSIDGLTPDDKDSLDLVSAVAERLGAHIDSLRQYEQTQSALAQSEKLFEASRRLTQATDLQQLVGSAVTALEITEVNRALLTSFDYDSTDEVKQLTVTANWWNGEGTQVTPIGTRYPLEVIQVMPMFVSSTPVFFNDTFTDERVDATTMELVKKLNLRAVAILPLHLGSRQVGALILEAEKPHHFTTDETRLFISLAPQIATVLENRQQYEKAQHQAEREAKLNIINQKIQSATTVDAVLQIAARELGNALGAPLTIAQLGLKNRSNGN